MFMRTVIIENEYDMPEEIQAFIDDNPGVLGEIDLQIGSRHRPVRDLGKSIVQADAVALASTFMYKDQLEAFVTAFAVGPLSERPLKFYVYQLTYRMNEWTAKQEDGSFKDSFLFNHIEEFAANLRRLVKLHEVYSIESDSEGEYDRPGFGILAKSRRLPLKAYRVYYSSEFDVFYNENESPQTVRDELA